MLKNSRLSLSHDVTSTFLSVFASSTPTALATAAGAIGYGHGFPFGEKNGVPSNLPNAAHDAHRIHGLSPWVRT